MDSKGVEALCSGDLGGAGVVSEGGQFGGGISNSGGEREIE
jgi:hypothetical protein